MATRRLTRSRPSRKLPESLDRRLNLYSLAASAAGVSVLALASPADAKIIYTKANDPIKPNTTLLLDLNHDGATDFKFENMHRSAGTTGDGSAGVLFITPAQSKNGVLGHTLTPFASKLSYASALFPNVAVGPKGQFLGQGNGLMAATSTTAGRQPEARRPFEAPGSGGIDPWANVNTRYLGLKFEIKGETHFGWARLDVKCLGTFVSATLTGYAYETVPNLPILTGKEDGPDDDGTAGSEPFAQSAVQVESAASLGQLAGGADTLLAWRRSGFRRELAARKSTKT